MFVPPVLRVFLLSLCAFPVAYLANRVSTFEEPSAVLGLGVAAVLVVFSIAYAIVRCDVPVDCIFYFFSVCAFTSVIDLIIGLEQDGYISGFMEFYMNEGEPYLRTAYGIMICYWDGSAHYILYLLMVMKISNGQSYRNVGLYWLGSLSMSMIVFLPGNVLGKYSTDIRPAFLLNIFFIVLPIWAGLRVFENSRPAPEVATDKIVAEQNKLPHQRLLDSLLLTFLVFAITFTVFRGFVSLECPLDSCFTYVYQYEPYIKDPVAYPRLQMLVYLFYALPLLCFFAYGLLVPGCTWMLDWTLIFAGAVAQAQFSHIGSSLHLRTPFTYRVPEESMWPVLLLNLLYAIGPQILALRCLRHPEFFLRVPSQTEMDLEKKQK
ncbi:transmembrane 6 superfamily member 2b [Erpetoichthys calabaricus]|uniref:Transmembrane 6 superfamily member 2b n=1 Tax=Erpetoichthys calabaricus TaxID=27687 RepID=A0A8C4SY53_ERPCA|nr:transmembrane 6 superfamily member 2b [Erpetoichthys calabaricus]